MVTTDVQTDKKFFDPSSSSSLISKSSKSSSSSSDDDDDEISNLLKDGFSPISTQTEKQQKTQLDINEPVQIFNSSPSLQTKEFEDDKVTVSSVSFKPFSSQKERKLQHSFKNTTILPNLHVIKLALTFNLMPGNRMEKQRNELIESLSGFPNDRILLLLTSIDQKFKGIYILDEDCQRATKFQGKGPTVISEPDIGRFLKFNTSTKSFDQFPSKTFTQTTDGICLKRSIEPQSW